MQDSQKLDFLPQRCIINRERHRYLCSKVDNVLSQLSCPLVELAGQVPKPLVILKTSWWWDKCYKKGNENFGFRPFYEPRSIKSFLYLFMCLLQSVPKIIINLSMFMLIVSTSLQELLIKQPLVATYKRFISWVVKISKGINLCKAVYIMLIYVILLG